MDVFFSVNWLTPLSAETCSLKFLFHDRALDEHPVLFETAWSFLMLFCWLWCRLRVRQDWIMAPLPWRRHRFQPWYKAIRLGLMLLRTTPYLFLLTWGHVVDLELFCTWCRIGFREFSGWQNWMVYHVFSIALWCGILHLFFAVTGRFLALLVQP